MVVDDGRCRSYDQSCLPGASKAHGDRFAMEDQSIHWFASRCIVDLLSSIVTVTVMYVCATQGGGDRSQLLHAPGARGSALVGHIRAGRGAVIDVMIVAVSIIYKNISKYD